MAVQTLTLDVMNRGNFEVSALVVISENHAAPSVLVGRSAGNSELRPGMWLQLVRCTLWPIHLEVLTTLPPATRTPQPLRVPSSS